MCTYSTAPTLYSRSAWNRTFFYTQAMSPLFVCGFLGPLWNSWLEWASQEVGFVPVLSLLRNVSPNWKQTLKEQWLCAPLIDRMQGVSFCCFQTLTPKLVAQLGRSHMMNCLIRTLSILLFLSLSQSCSSDLTDLHRIEGFFHYRRARTKQGPRFRMF